MAYRDLREYLDVLTEKGLLKWVDAEVDKDWEITCIARKVSRKPPEERHALGFRNVKGHSSPVVTGTIGASREVYATALQIGSSVEQIIAKWEQATTHHQEAELVKTGVCQEIVRKENDADLTWFPIPTWTPAKDPGPYLTAPCMITKDPETGIRNVGIYRVQVKGPRKTGVLWDLPSQHGAVHYLKYETLGKPMPVAVVVGVDPCILMAAAAKVPLDVDELAVAGALREEPVPLVKCKTIDVEVPASAEIVLEGEIE